MKSFINIILLLLLCYSKNLSANEIWSYDLRGYREEVSYLDSRPETRSTRSFYRFVYLKKENNRDAYKQLTPDEPKDDCSQYSSIKWMDYKGGEWYNQPTSRIYRSKGTPTMDKLQALGKLDEL